MAKHQYLVDGYYDTETSTVGSGKDSRAYPCLYIYNDVSQVKDKMYYKPGDGDNITFYRTIEDFIPRIDKTIERGIECEYTPIIAAYNLYFDLEPLLKYIVEHYYVRIMAQNGTTIYTCDLYDKETIDTFLPYKDHEKNPNISDIDLACLKRDEVYPVLRFWDMWHLDRTGLASMGVTAGLPKAIGDWDYSLVRTPVTPLTDQELHYASRDVQVLPAYVAYLLRAHQDWLSYNMLGSKVMTSTSLLRQDAEHTIGKLKKPGNKTTLLSQFSHLCKKNLPLDFGSYALRKACFRGGLTFTATLNALQTHHRVISLDVTSMHHTFITGRKIPLDFRRCVPAALRRYVNATISVPLDQVLAHYDKPLPYGLHVRVQFTNIRLKKGTTFERNGIAIIPESKFSKARITEYVDPGSDATEAYLRNNTKFVDEADHAVFAHSKLVSAKVATLHLTEVELWCIAQCYEWDTITVIEGEAASKWAKPPAYVALQSMKWYRLKQAAKKALAIYAENNANNKPTTYDDIPAELPDGIRKAIGEGTYTIDDLTAYYQSTIKGMFNAIYGTQAQDVFKPEYAIDNEANISVDKDTVINEYVFGKKYDDMMGRKYILKVLYTYGMRIVAGSRMHLIIAMILLDQKYGDTVVPTGGDTDSIKCSIPQDADPLDVEHALDPILDAATAAINACMDQYRADYPDYAADMKHVGGYEAEDPETTPYTAHEEYWLKARASVDKLGHVHVTMAGLTQRPDRFSIADAMNALIDGGYAPEDVLHQALGYNVYVGPSIAHYLQHTKPDPMGVFDEDVTDYLGNTMHVTQPQAIALYEVGRQLGQTDSSLCNAESIDYLRRRDIAYDVPRQISAYTDEDGKQHVEIIEIETGRTIMEV